MGESREDGGGESASAPRTIKNAYDGESRSSGGGESRESGTSYRLGKIKRKVLGTVRGSSVSYKRPQDIYTGLDELTQDVEGLKSLSAESRYELLQRLKRKTGQLARASGELDESQAEAKYDLLDRIARMGKKLSSEEYSGGLGKKLGVIVGICAGLLLLTPNITGNAIAEVPIKATSFLGTGLIVVGLIAGFFWLKK